MTLVAVLLCSACSSIPRTNEERQLVRIENQTLSRFRAYASSDTSPEVRVLLGTLEPNQSQYFQLPSIFARYRGLVVRCEKGRPNGLKRANMYFQTSAVALTRLSMLVVRLRDPIDYSDFTVLTMD